MENMRVKATDFANFFDFSIRRAGKSDNTDSKYIIEDIQECFQPRYIDKVEELPDCVDICLPDMMADLRDEFGFKENPDSFATELEQMRDFAFENGIAYATIFACICEPQKYIINDM